MSKPNYYTALITERLGLNRIEYDHSDKPMFYNQYTSPRVGHKSYKLKGGCLLFVLANNDKLTKQLKYIGRKM